MNEINVNGVVYVEKEKFDNSNYVIVRCDRTGAFAGFLKERNDRQVTLNNARRLWYWKGAASLSQLAMEGVSKPKECKFPCEVDEVTVLDAIEILKVTEKAKKSIDSVPIWSA